MKRSMARNDVIRSSRILRGWTQAELAEASGLSERLIRRAESGESIAYVSASLMAKALQVPTDWILSNGGAPYVCHSSVLRAQDYLNEIWNGKSIDFRWAAIAPLEFSYQKNLGVTWKGSEIELCVEEFFRSFVDFEIKVQNYVDFGMCCVVRWSCFLTHAATWLDIPATKLRANFLGSSWLRIVEDRFDEAWHYWDPSLLHKQLSDEVNKSP